MLQETVNVLHPQHRQFENEIADILTQVGFHTYQLTYHETLPKQVVRVLQNRYSPTALYLRGRADRIAIHKTLPIEFEWEAKTHNHRNLHDMLVEALPLIHHISKAKLGVKCLYAYRDPHANIECGFWVHDLPEIRQIHLPPRWTGETRQYYKEVLENWFGTGLNLGSVNGTGDPFIIIDESVIRTLPHWINLVCEEFIQSAP